MIGNKMKLLRLSKSVISIRERKAVEKVLKKGFLGMGPEVNQFEKDLKGFFKREVVCFNSGTAALQIALQASGIGANDEVLVPSITYVASYQAISATGAKPISCDIDLKNMQVSLIDLKKRVTKKTKAIMPVHFAGSASQIKEIYKFAKKNNLRVIEDAAHAFGTKINGRKIGSFGDITCFSFDGIKNITSGEGGCLVTSDKKVLALARDLRLLGIENESDKRYAGHRSWISDVKQQGWRYHMSDINASIGRVQLKRFGDLSKLRKKICKLYDTKFKNHNFIKLFKRNYKEEVPHIYVVRILKLKKREYLRKLLLKKGIQTGIHYYPNYKYSKYKDSKKLFPNTEKIYKELLTLPLHPEINEKDVSYIYKTLNETINNFTFD